MWISTLNFTYHLLHKNNVLVVIAAQYSLWWELVNWRSIMIKWNEMKWHNSCPGLLLIRHKSTTNHYFVYIRAIDPIFVSEIRHSLYLIGKRYIFVPAPVWNRTGSVNASGQQQFCSESKVIRYSVHAANIYKEDWNIGWEKRPIWGKEASGTFCHAYVVMCQYVSWGSTWLWRRVGTYGMWISHIKRVGFSLNGKATVRSNNVESPG